MNDRTITIFLADDHTIVRQGLASLLAGEPRFKVVGEAENGRQAVSMVEALKPEIVIMDISMPLLNGIEATRLIKKNRPQTKVIILSMHTHDRYVTHVRLVDRTQPHEGVPQECRTAFQPAKAVLSHVATSDDQNAA